MSDRYYRKDADRAMIRLAAALGKPWADDAGRVCTGPQHEAVEEGRLWETDGHTNRACVGAWFIDDYQGVYIAEMGNEGGGQHTPFGHDRRSYRDFCDAVRFALDALHIAKAPA